MAISTYPDTSGKIEMAIPIDLAHCEPDCVLLLYSSREVQPSVVVLSVTRLGDLSPFGRYFEHSGDNIRNWQLKVNPIYKSKAYWYKALIKSFEVIKIKFFGKTCTGDFLGQFSKKLGYFYFKTFGHTDILIVDCSDVL